MKLYVLSAASALFGVYESEELAVAAFEEHKGDYAEHAPWHLFGVESNRSPSRRGENGFLRDLNHDKANAYIGRRGSFEDPRVIVPLPPPQPPRFRLRPRSPLTMGTQPR